MKIDSSIDTGKLLIQLDGKLDSISAPELERFVMPKLPDCQGVIFDFSQISYISSAGLRVLLGVRKTMKRDFPVIVKNVAPVVMEVFEMTGFVDILTIQ